MTGRVLVVGSGVIGLTTGICLAEAGAAVTIRGAEPPERTTSFAAGAVWGPVHVGPQDKVREWARESLGVLSGLAAEPGTGVRIARGRELTRSPGVAPPHWADLAPGLRVCQRDELPPGFAGGWEYRAPLATMPVYLEYLRRRFLAAGGVIETGVVTSLAAAGDAHVVVNCTGVAARELVPDPAVYPMRGQVVIAANPGIEEFFISRDEPPPGTVYFFPHGEDILIGGTVEEGACHLTPDPDTARRILANAAAVEPRLRDVTVRGHRVGLRPCRPQVRLEREVRDGIVIWHNYGHGGGGISVSWGCAAEITAGVLGT